MNDNTSNKEFDIEENAINTQNKITKNLLNILKYIIYTLLFLSINTCGPIILIVKPSNNDINLAIGINIIIIASFIDLIILVYLYMIFTYN